MSLLQSEISDLFGSVFSTIYLDGTLTIITRTSDGQGGGTTTPNAQPVKLQIDACTERQKLEQGYSARDVRILILQSGVSNRPVNGSQVTAKSRAYTVGPVITEDPASSYWEIRGIPV